MAQKVKAEKRFKTRKILAGVGSATVMNTGSIRELQLRLEELERYVAHVAIQIEQNGHQKAVDSGDTYYGLYFTFINAVIRANAGKTNTEIARALGPDWSHQRVTIYKKYISKGWREDA